jgi:hypothetical protein
MTREEMETLADLLAMRLLDTFAGRLDMIEEVVFADECTLPADAQNQALAGAHLILERKIRMPSPFKARDIAQKRWSGLTSSKEVAASLTLLMEYGYLFELGAPGRAAGGRPTKIYQWGESSLILPDITVASTKQLKGKDLF